MQEFCRAVTGRFERIVDNEGEKLRLYTIQPLAAFEQIRACGVFRSEPDFVDEPKDDLDRFMLAAYEWIAGEMDRRCAVSRPPGVRFPVWAWHSWMDSRRRKPDMRFGDVRGLPGDGPNVMMTLEMPDSEVLLSDYEAWHFVLNRWYLGSEEQTEDFDARCTAAGLNAYENDVFPDTELERERVASWSAIFDPQRAQAQLDPSNAGRDSSVQATFWEIRTEHIVEAVRIEHGQRAVRIASKTDGVNLRHYEPRQSIHREP